MVSPSFSARTTGRERDSQHLQTLARETFGNRDVKIVQIQGDTGVGKSRLLTDFVEWMNILPELIWLFSTNLTPMVKMRPFGLIRQVLDERFFIDRSDTIEITQQKLVDGFAEFWDDLVLEQAYFIGYILGYGFEDHPLIEPLRDDPRQCYLRAIQYFADFMRLLGDTYPIVFIVDDGQWADVESIEFLGQVSRLLYDTPWLVLTALSSDDNDWSNLIADPITKIELLPLTDHSAHILVAEIFRNISQIPPTFADRVVQHTSGNPRCIWQMIRWLYQQNVIYYVNETNEWSFDTGHPRYKGDWPQCHILLTPLAELSETDWTVINAAAVIGFTFWDNLLADLLPEIDTGVYLEVLQAHQLVVPQLQSLFSYTTEYQFMHPETQQWVYKQLPAETRHDYHRQVATWFLGKGADRIRRFPALVASHFQAAAETERAVKWYAMAARLADERYANHSAVLYYQYALDLITDDGEEKLPLLLALGRVYLRSEQYHEAQSYYEQALTLAEKFDETQAKRVIWTALTQIYLNIGQINTALKSVSQAETFTAQGHPHQAVVYVLQARIWLALENYDRAKNYAEQALQLSIDRDDPKHIMDSLEVLALAQAGDYDFGRAAIHLAEALQLAQYNQFFQRAAELACRLGDVSCFRGDYPTALGLYQQAEQLGRKIGDFHFILTAGIHLAGVWMELGQYRDAYHYLDEMINLAGGDYRLLALAMPLLAEAQLVLGDESVAIMTAQRALQYARYIDNTRHMAHAWRILGQLQSGTDMALTIDGKTYTAEQCFTESYQLLNEQRYANEQVKTLEVWAQTLWEIGDIGRSRALWEQVLNFYMDIDATQHLKRVHQHLMSIGFEG